MKVAWQGAARHLARQDAGRKVNPKGEFAMQNSKFGFALYSLAILLFVSVAVAHAAPQDANFVGTWNLTITGGGGHQGGDQGEAQGEGGEHRGGGPQSITVSQDGGQFKVSHKTQRGDTVSNATVSGNTISWTEERPGRDGNTRKIEFKATLDGGTLKGTMAGGKFNRGFTAKRST
jgi:hypothetical protein